MSGNNLKWEPSFIQKKVHYHMKILKKPKHPATKSNLVGYVHLPKGILHIFKKY